MNSTWLMTPSSRLRLAMRNAGARGVGACSRGRERIARGREAIERLLDFETDLLRDLFLAQHDLAFGCARLAHARLRRRRHRTAAT